MGRIGVVDADEVDVTNLQRQVAHATTDLGRNKAESAAQTMRAVNPLIEVETHPLRLSPDNALEIMAHYDVMLDGTDNFPTRYLINDGCALLGKPLVTAAILRYSGQLTVVKPKEGPCYRCFFPEPPAPGAVPSCSQAGILGPVGGVMGSLQALEAMKLLLGSPVSAVGRYIAVDFVSLESSSMEFERNPRCAICGDDPTITTLELAGEPCSAGG